MAKTFTIQRRVLWAALAALVLIPLAVLFVLGATDDTDNIALSRNQVIVTPQGRVWKGTWWNHSDSLYTELDAVILFLDRDGKPVGQGQGGARRLDPGEVFHMEAKLPSRAVSMRVYQLRWAREGGPRIALGPYRIWDFGTVMDERCGETRLAIGSCAEQREQD
jgi:hypothetical protein